MNIKTMQWGNVNLHVLNIRELRFGTDDSRTEVLDEYCMEHFPLRTARASRYRFEDDRLRCIGAGILIRDKLELEESEILTGEYGKPYSLKSPWHFSISHSGDFVVLAVSDRAAGVDVESLQSLAGKKETEAIAGRVFTAEEKQWAFEGNVREDSREDREDNGRWRKRFLKLWTMKESISKATGKGLSMDFSSFGVLPLVSPVENGNDQKAAATAEGKFFCGRSFESGGYCLSVCEENIT